MSKSSWYLDYKKWFYLILCCSWVTGITFFIFNNFIIIQGEFGEEKHFLQYPVLKTHGIFAFAIMVTYGFFLGAHVRKSWKVKPQPVSGIIIMIMPILLIISGWLLYYIATDNSRQIVSLFHFSIGLLLPIALIIHIRDVTSQKGKRKYKYRKGSLVTKKTINL